MRIGLFAGETYYPQRGVKDWQGFFESVASARAAGTAKEDDFFTFDWYQIVDTDTMSVLEQETNKRF